MASPVGQGGGLQFIPGSIGGQIGKQVYGVLGNMTLPDSNQLNSQIIQCQPILASGFQQFFVKADNVAHVEANFSKNLSGGQNFANAAFGKGNQTVSGGIGKGTGLFLGE